MRYLTPTPNPSGAYPAPQSNPFKGAIPLTDEQAQMVVDYNGFVTVTSHEETIVEDFTKTVYEVTPNLEAWEKWKASQPEPEEIPPSKEEQLRADVDYLALMTGVDLV